MVPVTQSETLGVAPRGCLLGLHGGIGTKEPHAQLLGSDSGQAHSLRRVTAVVCLNKGEIKFPFPSLLTFKCH